jgi:propionyl-CoA synthetase
MSGPALPVAPGLCGDCRYAARNTTRRGPTYLRCTRATWDDRLVRYPRLPVTACVGFETPPPPAVRVT